MLSDITLKQGEAKTITFTVKTDGTLVDLSSCTLAFGIRTKSGTAAIVTKDDADFGKDQAAAGIVSVFLDGTDTNQVPGDYVGELKIAFPGAPATVDKSADLSLEIVRATTS